MNFARSMLALSLSLAVPFGAALATDEAAGGAATGGRMAKIREATEAVDDAKLARAAEDPNDWLMYGGTYLQQRFSPLKQINAANVDKLTLRWSYPTQTNRGLEATPVVVDGVMYTTGPWSLVFALDAKTGQELWKYDPQVPKEYGRNACCDVVNRGVAVYKGKVYVGTLDGRLVALDAASGKPVWEQWTHDRKVPYTITGAPIVVKGKVLIGNGGSEYGVRGYLSAYDGETGKLAWRTFTVPGDPSKPFESEAIEEAAKTWHGEEWLKRGAGGTAWDSISYDPELNLLYFGTGNGTAWVREIRSPGGGDNLYLSSILAVDADTGRLRWYYQTTPGDNWDFDATQQPLLSDLTIGGKKRRVLMQAAKNGFFYVLDRETGKLLSANPFVEVTWAKKVDLKSGRPIEAQPSNYTKGVSVMKPSAFGAHNWQPMSFSPLTGLVYIPAQEVPGAYMVDQNFKVMEGEWNVGIDFDPFEGLNRKLVSGHLLAWDPVRGKEAWRAQYKLPWNGGTLATAGNLVFQGTSTGRFVAYSADKGKELWEAPAGGTGIIAGPMTYMVDGVQYVTVSAGWGGAFALVGGDAAAAAGVKAGGLVLTFALEEAKAQAAPAPESDPVRKGDSVYHHWCARCHGAAAISGGVLPDLRHSTEDVQKSFAQIVKNGIPGTGMAGFGKWLSDDDVRTIQRYIRKRAEDEHAGRP